MSTETGASVEYLRRCAAQKSNYVSPRLYAIFAEAADEIERLQGEVQQAYQRGFDAGWAEGEGSHS